MDLSRRFLKFNLMVSKRFLRWPGGKSGSFHLNDYFEVYVWLFPLFLRDAAVLSFSRM